MDVPDAVLHRIALDPFRAGFRLLGKGRAMVGLRGTATIRKQAEDLIGWRPAPAEPRNDGRQTPCRGHPVFVARHATATWCRNCLARWHDFPAGRALDGGATPCGGHDVPLDCRTMRRPRSPGMSGFGAKGVRVTHEMEGGSMSDAIVRPAGPELKVATIGVYGFDGPSFLYRLQSAKVSLLLDVRQRRGVRGSDYAWANSRRLQAALADAGIGYKHHPELAPTTELRHLQYAEDDRLGVGKRSRQKLADAYTRRYTVEILDHANLTAIVSAFPQDGIAALLCVECSPEACHRSLIAQRLSDLHGVAVHHLRP
jgi:hypothetical protein